MLVRGAEGLLWAKCGPGTEGYGIGDRTQIGKGGKTYRAFYSMSLETEGYLDAVNHPNFPTTIVPPTNPLHEITVFKFSVGNQEGRRRDS